MNDILSCLEEEILSVKDIARIILMAASRQREEKKHRINKTIKRLIGRIK